ncbi:MAG: C4-dicarboxylate ABC transporter permease, partial [Mailhella sp.]|nr:C4-dicarboxylate ABC transporter permease [Mailhella sp.]
MTAATIGLLLFCVFFGLLFIGSPIMVALGLSTYAVYFLVGKDPVMLIQMAAASLSSFPLMALP